MSTPSVQSGQDFEKLSARLQKLEDLLASKSVPSLDKETISTYKHEPEGRDLEVMKNMNLVELDAFESQPFVSTYLTSDEKVSQVFTSSFLPLNTPMTRPTMDQSILSLLPSRTEAGYLFDYYIDNLVSMYHILHVPTVRSMLDTLYQKLENNQQPRYDQLALLSSIFALSAYFTSPTSRFQFKGPEAKIVCYRWTFVAQQALISANYIIQPTIETIQTSILIAAHLLPNMGAMAMFRSLMASALLGAKQLKLHLVDSEESRKRRQGTQSDWIDIEVKRRVWWHLVSTDWIMGFMSGAQCGSYMISPKHFKVDKPTNVDDIKISSLGPEVYVERDKEIPTDISYFLMRVNISILFREIVDAAAEMGSFDELPYDLVLTFDKRLSDSLVDLPKYMHIDLKSRQENKDLDQKYPTLPFLRQMGHFGAQNRLTRLHRPYLARGSRDPKYSYSRMICLRSARSVIELGNEMTGPKQEFEHIKLWTVVHHFFTAVLILVMDFCLNREEPRAEERKAEILDCFRLLEACQEESTLAKRGLQQLRDLLKGSAKSDPSSPPAPAHARLPDSQDSHFKPSVVAGPEFQQQYFPPEAEAVQSTSLYSWSDMDFASMNNLNFDFELDESQFDSIFQNLEGSHPMY